MLGTILGPGIPSNKIPALADLSLVREKIIFHNVRGGKGH